MWNISYRSSSCHVLPPSTTIVTVGERNCISRDLTFAFAVHWTFDNSVRVRVHRCTVKSPPIAVYSGVLHRSRVRVQRCTPPYYDPCSADPDGDILTITLIIDRIPSGPQDLLPGFSSLNIIPDTSASSPLGASRSGSLLRVAFRSSLPGYRKSGC